MRRSTVVATREFAAVGFALEMLHGTRASHMHAFANEAVPGFIFSEVEENARRTLAEPDRGGSHEAARTTLKHLPGARKYMADVIASRHA